MPQPKESQATPSEPKKEGDVRLDLKVVQLPPDPSTGKQWWTFTVNGRPSHYRSSNPGGLERTMKALLFGRKSGTVRVKVATSGAKGQGQGSASVSSKEWDELPTQAERVEAFLTRGKLGRQKT